MVDRRLAVVMIVSMAVAAPSAAAQLGGLIKRKVQERVEKKIIECIATDVECIRKAKADGNEVKVKEAPPTKDGTATTTTTTAAADGAVSSSLKPGEGAWVNYDFKPGERPLFVEDFTKEEVGNFPRRLEFKDGNMEVAEWQGGRYLRISSWPGTFAVNLPEQLPSRFTLEFDTTPGYNSNWIIVKFADKAIQDVRFRLYGGKGNGGVFGNGLQANGMTPGALGAGPFRARIMADDRYVKVYINDTRVANIPNADLGRSKTITFEIPGHESEPVLLTNLSVMAGGKKLYDALAESGRVATQGIYFDTGSDRLRPESTPTLKEIGEMLKEHADLNLTIEGHTDNVGNAQANLDLSNKRAAAVKSFLVSTYGIGDGRLKATGLGDTKPAAANTTPEGRQQNRRVELVKQ
jgi:OmpA-OmpF porin, OOP family